MNKNIILCGFMGSGKTVTGKALAKKLNLEFIDLDQHIEKAEGLTVNEIFDRFGEQHFRALETKAANILGAQSGKVIALGGGTVLKKENLLPLKLSGIIFYLEVGAEKVIDRLKNDTTRPLLKKNKEQAVFDLLKSREPFYKAAADYIIDANGSVDDTLKQILKLLENIK